MSRFADIRVEWRVNDIERSIRDKADSHQVYQISSDVDSLERSLRETSSETSRLRDELCSTQDQLYRLEKRLEVLEID